MIVLQKKKTLNKQQKRRRKKQFHGSELKTIKSEHLSCCDAKQGFCRHLPLRLRQTGALICATSSCASISPSGSPCIQRLLTAYRQIYRETARSQVNAYCVCLCACLTTSKRRCRRDKQVLCAAGGQRLQPALWQHLTHSQRRRPSHCSETWNLEPSLSPGPWMNGHFFSFELCLLIERTTLHFPWCLRLKQSDSCSAEFNNARTVCRLIKHGPRLSHNLLNSKET